MHDCATFNIFIQLTVECNSTITLTHTHTHTHTYERTVVSTAKQLHESATMQQ